MNGLILAVFSMFALASSVYVRSSALETCAADGSNDYLIEHEECTKFYECSGGTPIALSCPNNLYYNDKIKACDWPENVDCENRAVKDVAVNDDPEQSDITPQKEAEPLEINADPSKAKEICAAAGTEGTLVAHEDCTKFYICLNSVPVAYSCGNNPVLYYNPELKGCDWPEKVSCESRVVNSEADVKVEVIENAKNNIDSDATNSYEENAVKICAADESDGVLLSHGDCDKFYKCSGGQPFTLQCPVSPRLLYNPDFQFCDWAARVDCGDRKQ